MFFVSTGGAIYGEQPHLPISEDVECRPISSYGITKYQAEVLILQASQLLNSTQVTILRPSNIYGGIFPIGKKNGLINVFTEAIRHSRQLQLFGPETIRDFLHVQDFSQALSHILQAELPPGLILNIGTGSGYSLLEVVNLILSEVSAPSWLSHSMQIGPRPSYEPSYNVLNIKKLTELVQWSPSISLSSGVKMTLA